MDFRKAFTKLLVCIILSSLITTLKANYYEPDLFPIGLTGLGNTKVGGGISGDNDCPYQTAPTYTDGWRWTHQEKANQNEQDLIFDLGVNCIGSEDAWPGYVFDPKIVGYTWDNTYLHKVSKPSLESGSIDDVYVITVGYRAPLRRLICSDTNTLCQYQCSDSLDEGGWSIKRASTMFRSPFRPEDAGCSSDNWGSALFSPYSSKYEDSTRGWGCHGTHYNNWSDFDGDSIWTAMMDTAIYNFEAYFDTNNTEDYADCIWGYNLITEGPATYRNGDPSGTLETYPEGCWAAVDRVFNGDSTVYKDSIEDRRTANHAGFRGIEQSCDDFGGKRRMIVAKAGTWPLIKSGTNIFQSLPDIDIFFLYGESLCRGDQNYGDQEIFDNLIYGTEPYRGYHNAAVYMQTYGGTNLAYPGQRRRWIPAICLRWKGINASETRAEVRRPCPPEIRCAAYLLLSRGAKGIFFNSWLTAYGTETPEPANIEVPASGSGDLVIGMRDYTGWPYGHPDAPPANKNFHKLNAGPWPGSDPRNTYWHGTATDSTPRIDRTYEYLKDTLIDEIKAISNVLMQLEWDSAFSLKSTVTSKASPCPHLYVDSVTTTDSGYIDLGFFSPYYWQDQGKYLMVVNRDGIRDMDTATITLYLDFLEGDTFYSLHVTEFGDPNTDTILARAGDGYFHLTREFAPGQGKLFRFYPIKTGKETPLLLLWGECKKTYGTTNMMEGLSEVDTFCAELTWTWSNYKPSDLTAMKLWMKEDDTWECIREDHPTDEYNYTDTVFMCCDSCCAEFLEFGYHPSGDTITEPEWLSGAVGTKSDSIEVCCNMTSGCPELYSLIHYDTTTGHLFLGNNTILPHSEHYESPDVDLLKLDMLNTDPDYYYMNILENASTTTFLDQAKLWVVDHDEGTQVATSTDDSIYVYSEMAVPISCKDNQDNDRLDEVLWQDGLSFVGSPNSYVIAEFDDPEWTNKGILAVIDGAEAAKASIIDLQKVGGGGEGWDSIGVTYARLNSSQWLIDVSDADSLRFRLTCGGSDTTRINRIALVKLESGWSKREATLDSAVRWIPSPQGGYVDFDCRIRFLASDTLCDTLLPDYQWSLAFGKVDSSTTYPLRDFVFQSRGYYSTVITPPSGIEEAPLQFGLRVEQLTPLSRIALINYSVPYLTHVKIGVYDIAGRLVLEVVDEEVKPGRHCFEWKGCDYASRTVASGVYFVKMTTDEYKKTHKMVILE